MAGTGDGQNLNQRQCWDRTPGAGELGRQHGQQRRIAEPDSTVGIAQPGQTREDGRQNITARTGQMGQDNRGRTARKVVIREEKAGTGHWDST
jgi:hypothetical protein